MTRPKSVALAFLSGAVLVGGLLGFTADRVMFGDRLCEQKRDQGHLRERLAADLGLDDRQRAAVDSLLDARDVRVRALYAPLRPKADSLYLVTRDALLLARSKDEAADIGQLWVVAMMVMTFGLLYKSLLSMNDFGYLFWYFSGLVASRAAVVRHKAARRVTHRAPESWRLAIDGPHAHVKG